MNKRIKELITQAGTDTSGKWLSIDNTEKFAELIVQECVNVSLKNSARHDDMGAILASNIKRHFGIEE